MNYECGAEPIGPAWVRFPVGFYLVALVFIVFDALAVFLFPWALVLRTAGLGAFWVMAVFVGIIRLGWPYAHRGGVLLGKWRPPPQPFRRPGCGGSRHSRRGG